MNNEEFQKIVLEKFNSIENEVGSIKNELKEIKEDSRLHRIQTKENTDILKALMHSVEVAHAKDDRMAIDIAHIKGEVTAIKKDLSTVELVTANNYADLAKLKAVK